jgi:orotate phosphoribosyltransferase
LLLIRNKQASVRDIEALIERRNATNETAQRAMASLHLLVTSMAPASEFLDDLRGKKD